MGFFSKLVDATVKVALTPVAVVSDVVNVVNGEEPDTTATLVGSAVNDVEQSVDNLAEGNL